MEAAGEQRTGAVRRSPAGNRRRADVAAITRTRAGKMRGNGPARALLMLGRMRVESHKFRTVLDLHHEQIIHFPQGLIGLSGEKEFVLFEREQSPRVAWLQSVRTPELALPVVSGHELAHEYPDVPVDRALFSDDLPPLDEDTAVMVVLTCQLGMPPTVNMTSPILVDTRTRQGRQVILQGTRFATREILALRPLVGENDTTVAAASEEVSP